MTYYTLRDRRTGERLLPGWHWKSRVSASEARMELAAERAGWDRRADPTPEQKAKFFEHNNAVDIVSDGQS